MPNWTKEQSLAINEDGKNIIVSAGAGSGKTAVLSERVLRKLKSGINIDELLILTFTNAAALEMKERIRKKISKECILSSQLDKIDNAYITTFDSYALSIVKKYNYLLNVSKNVSIVEKSIIDLEKERIIDDIFDELYLNKNKLFLKLIDDFCTKDDIEIKNYIIQINNKLDMIYDKEMYLNTYFSKYFSDEFIEVKIKEYEELLVNKIGELNKYFILLEEYLDSDTYEKFNNTLYELLISNNYDLIKSNLISIPQLPKNSENDAKEIKNNMNLVLKEIKTMCSFKDKDEIKESIYKTKDYVSIIIEIIKKYDSKINEYKNKHDLYEFVDIAKMAIKVIKENENIKTTIKNNLNEILIDEYQDTNDLQDLFISLIENNNVYMVGDIKQSIYRFRNANPNLFKEKYDKYSLLNGGIKIDLNKNFRSRDEVLSNINLIFNLIMDNFIGGAEYSKTHQMIFGNKTYNNEGKLNQNNNIEIYNYKYDKTSLYKKEEIEIFTIANDIKNKIENNYKIFDKDNLCVRNLKYNDIVILMDRSTNFNLYKKIFEYLNIPLTIYKDESITDSIDIVIIKNIISLILSNNYNQEFKYSFISIMRSFLFNESDEEIFNYFVNNNYNDSKLMNIIKSIDYDTMTPKELIETIVNSFDYYNKIITVGNVESHMVVIEYLLNLSDSLTKIGYTINDFYEYLKLILDKKYDIRYSLNKDDNGVKIMTIHKSKGLEYHICYYSGLYSKFNISDLKERFILDNTYGIVTPYFDNGIRNTIYKDLLKNKYLKDEISEKIRLFYVALTRAKEKMILVCQMDLNETNVEDIVDNSIRMKYTSFLDILNSIKSNISNYITNINIDNIGLTRNYNFIKTNNYKDLIDLSDEKLNVVEYKNDFDLIDELHFSKESHKLYSNEELENILYGKKVHKILENIDFNNPDYNKIDEFTKNNIIKFLSNEILEDVINIYKEYEFIYDFENIEYHGFIDLLLEKKDEFIIVDYKLKNIIDNAYLNQLNGYKKYIESITNKNVSIYLYSIIDGNLKKL